MKTNALRNEAHVAQVKSSCIDPLVLDKVVQFVPELWATLHRKGRSPLISEEARYRLHQILGAIPGIWAILLQNGERKFANAEERHRYYRWALQESNARHTIARDMCSLLGILASRRNAIWAASKDRECDNILSGAFWGLIGTGVFSQVQNTFRAPQVFTWSLSRYCAVLLDFWEKADLYAQNDNELGAAKVLISRITGLALFEGVRILENRQGERVVEELIHFYQNTQVRRQRGFFAGVAQGVHDLGLIREELVEQIALASREEAASLRRAKRLIERFAENLVLTGILSVVPV